MPLSLQLLNIQGLLGSGGRSKTGFIADLAAESHALVTMLTETHLTEAVLSSEITVNIPEYSIFRGDRAGRKGGGVALLVHENLSGELISSFDNGVVEFVIVKVHALNTVFCVMYRPPDTTLTEFNQALSELDTVISNLPAPTPTLVLGGDFNFPKSAVEWQRVDGVLVPAVHEHREEGTRDGPKVRLQAAKLMDMAHRHHMAQYVDKVTHGKEVLDLVFSNNPDLIHSINTETFPQLTDHSVITMTANYTLNKSPPRE